MQQRTQELLSAIARINAWTTLSNNTKIRLLEANEKVPQANPGTLFFQKNKTTGHLDVFWFDQGEKISGLPLTKETVAFFDRKGKKEINSDEFNLQLSEYKEALLNANIQELKAIKIEGKDPLVKGDKEAKALWLQHLNREIKPLSANNAHHAAQLIEAKIRGIISDMKTFNAASNPTKSDIRTKHQAALSLKKSLAELETYRQQLESIKAKTKPLRSWHRMARGTSPEATAQKAYNIADQQLKLISKISRNQSHYTQTLDTYFKMYSEENPKIKPEILPAKKFR